MCPYCRMCVNQNRVLNKRGCSICIVCVAMAVQFEVGRTNPTQFRVHTLPNTPQLNDGEVLLRIERFSLTANNVSYAMAGTSKMLQYYNHFPASDPKAWGIIPVWGLAVIEQSRSEHVQNIGE